MTKAHYSGALRIVKGRAITIISAGQAACSPGRLVDYMTHVRSEVTCKRCLRLIELAAVETEPEQRGGEAKVKP